MSKYNGKFKNLIAKKKFEIIGTVDDDDEIIVNKGEECTCIEYSITQCITSDNEPLPYKVVFKRIVDSEGYLAIQWFAKAEIENFFDIKGKCIK